MGVKELGGASCFCCTSGSLSGHVTVGSSSYSALISSVSAGPQHPLIKDHGIRNSRAGHVEVSQALLISSQSFSVRHAVAASSVLLWSGILGTYPFLRCYLFVSANSLATDPSSHLQDYNINTYHFDDQYSTFNSLGYGAAPEGTHYVGDDAAFDQHKGMHPPQKTSPG